MTAVNNVLSNFAKANARLKDARADTGAGSLGWWPPEAEYLVGLAAITVDEATFEYRTVPKGKNDQKRPAIKVQCKLQLLEDPDSPNAPRSFMDREFIIPYDTTGLPTAKGCNFAEQVRIAEERFKGLLCTALGIAEDGLDNAAAALQQLLERHEEKSKAGTFITMKVYTKHREDNKRPGKFYPDVVKYMELHNS